MKIGIVCPYDIYRHGGVQEQVKLHAGELESRGHGVNIICPTTLEEVTDEQRDPRVIEIGRATKANISKTSFELSVSAEPSEIDAMLELGDFDILHCHEPFLPMLARQIVTRTKCPVVATFHARQPDSIGGKSIEVIAGTYAKPFLDGIDKFVAASQPASQIISTITDKPIAIIPNTLRLSDWRAADHDYYRDFNDGVSTIVFISRLEKRKGAHYLIKAYEELLKTSHDRIRLVLGSDGPDRKSLELYCKQNGLIDVHFLGFVSDEDKKSLIKTASVFCAPAPYGESFGIVLIEAMAMGAPLVAGDNDGFASVMTGLGSMALVDPKSSSDFARRLRLVIEQERFRSVLLEWQNQQIPKYDVAVTIDEYLKIYQSAIDENQE